MGAISRRSLLTSSMASGPLMLAGCNWSGSDASPRGTDRSDTPLATFVSTPDFFNGDVGDLSSLPTWDGGANSINTSWESAIDKCLGALASHKPDAVLVAGDLVEGRWNLDTTGRALFGPVSQGVDPASLADCRKAITRAGSVYYGHYREMFESRGLTLLPAVGDHEILDDRNAPNLNDRWSPSGRILSGEYAGDLDNRYYLVSHSKRTWAKYFTTVDGGPRFEDRPQGTPAEATAYSVDIGPMLTLVTVDVFTLTSKGVRLGVFGDQLTWLRQTVRSAKRERRVVIVQGHVPILQPYREFVTGSLRLPEGFESPLYRLMAEEGVDFYFCGEVHDTTVRQRRNRGPIQLSHGSIFRYAFNYVVGHVYGDGTTEINYFEMNVERASESQLLWSTDENKWQRTTIEYGDPIHRGTLVVRDRQIRKRTKKLARYDAADDPWKYAGNLHPEVT